MPIQKPVQATIYALDFRDRVYTFVVESTLAPEATPGVVVVSASTGYWLSTPLSDRPRPEQTIPYKKQSDGSWLASSTVTVSYYGDALLDGTVTVQSSPTEAVMLAITASSTSLESAKGPVLMVSQSALTFAPTPPGKPGFQLITVTQRYTDGPVTITTDAPDHFQLATDSRPNFASSLLFTPAPTGTYVHVRYLASRRGVHTGQLIIQSSYDSKTIALTGRSAGLLPAVRLTRPASSRRIKPSRPGALVTGLRRGAGILSLLLVGGLTYSGYTNRCQLFPALCENTAISQPLTPVTSPELTSTPANDRSEKVARKEPTTQNKASIPVSATQQRSVERLADRPAPRPMTDGITQPQPVTASRSNAVREPASPKRLSNQVVDGVVNSRRVTSAPPTEESELERELNQSTRNQL